MSGRFPRFVGGVAVAVLGLAGRPALAQDELFVTNGDAVAVYSRTVDGDVAPVRNLAGAATGLSATRGLAVDLAHNELVVVNTGNNSITVYARTADGDVAPTRTIAGAATGLSNPFGLVLDRVNDELIVANLLGNSVTVYARTADGNALPLRTIAGATTGLNFPTGLALDTVHNELAVGNIGGNAVRVFARTANGDAAPVRTLAGASTALSSPQGLAIDTANDELVVVNSANNPTGNSVTVYARTADGNVAPLRKVVGAATGLCGPEGVALDTVNGELAVANPNDECGTSVTVFARTADGNAAPVRKLVGPTTGLFIPSFVTTTSDFPVAAISPTSGPASGGTPVVITGSAFQAGATASIGGVPATGINVVGPTEIDASTPALPPGTLNDVHVSIASLLPQGPSILYLPAGWMADFLDVPQGDIFHSYVEKVFRHGITAGCSGGNYCRNNAVTRAQMAVFLLKAEHGSGHAPPSCTGIFADVPCPGPYTDWIEELAAEGITSGCGGGNYCPNTPVTRQQMAVFLLKTEHGSAYTPPGCAGIFDDVPCPGQYSDWIERLSAEGVTGGCSVMPPLYCPTASNTRGEMAVFLVKTFSLP